MNANGPAVEGESVTRRKHRAETWFFSREIVTVRGGYGAAFASSRAVALGVVALRAECLYINCKFN
jgi:hypothetical protein